MFKLYFKSNYEIMKTWIWCVFVLESVWTVKSFSVFKRMLISSFGSGAFTFFFYFIFIHFTSFTFRYVITSYAFWDLDDKKKIIIWYFVIVTLCAQRVIEIEIPNRTYSMLIVIVCVTELNFLINFFFILDFISNDELTSGVYIVFPSCALVSFVFHLKQFSILSFGLCLIAVQHMLIVYWEHFYFLIIFFFFGENVAIEEPHRTRTCCGNGMGIIRLLIVSVWKLIISFFCWCKWKFNISLRR